MMLQVRVSFLEIYNERLDDLLATEPSSFMAEAAAAGGGGGAMGGRGGTAASKAGGGGQRMTMLSASGLLPSLANAGAGGADALSDARDRLKIVEDKRAGVRGMMEERWSSSSSSRTRAPS